MKIKSFLVLTLLLAVSFFSFQNMFVPDPELYAKSLLETLRKKDKAVYVKTFGVTTQDFKWIGEQIKNDPYTNELYRMRVSEKLADSTDEIADVNRELEENYEKFTQWVTEEEINLNELVYIRVFYNMHYEKRGLMHALESADIHVKHKEKYYIISINDAVYVNGRWVFGKISDISERDQYFDRIEGGYQYEEEYAMDTAMADTTYEAEYYAADTTAYVEYEYEEPVVSKKQQKIQKKIEALEGKTSKLYNEMYKY